MKAQITPLTQRWLDELKASGYHLTRPRRLIVEIITTSLRALEPIEIYDLGKKHTPRLGLVTVYRTLEKLESLGLVQRVHHPDGCHTYLPASQGHEHLLLCTTCGRAVTFSGDNLAPLLRSVARSSSFEIHEHWLQLYGLCPECRED